MVLEGVVQMYFDLSVEIPCAIFEKGSVFGEIELLLNKNRQFTCVALTRCRILSIDKKDFHNIFFKKVPQLGSALKKLLPIRLQGMQNILNNIDVMIKEYMKTHFPKTRQSLVTGNVFVSILNIN